MDEKPRRRMLAGAVRLLLLAAVIVFTALLVKPAAAQTDRTLTQSDNGNTITVAIGDTVTLRLGTDLDWSNSVMLSNTGVLRLQPFALARGVQGVWRAVAAGQTTISATGKPICAPGMACPQFLATFSAIVIVTGSPPPPPSGSVTYQPGWNIVGGPSGSTFPVGMFSWDSGRNQYGSLMPNTPVERGHGYWAYFTQPTTVVLASDNSSTSMPSVPGQVWALIANPTSSQCAGINVGPPVPPSGGAGPTVLAVYTYNPAVGNYGGGSSALLQPGQGAWVMLDRSGTVPITLAGSPAADGTCIPLP